MNFAVLFIGLLVGGITAWLVCASMMKLKMVSKSVFDKVLSDSHQLKTDIEVAKHNNASLQQNIFDYENQIEHHKYEINLLQKDIRAKENQLSSLVANNNVTKDINSKQLADNEQLKLDLKTKTEDYNELNKTAATLLANNKALNEKLDSQKIEVEEMRKQFNLEFEHIASKILDEKSSKFTKLNQDNLNGILKPLGENIELFKKRVEEVYVTEAKERFSLGEEVKKLQELNTRLSQEANNLTNALTGSSKTQGDWGQMILENILEKSGLTLNREYFVQEYLKDDDGRYLKNEHGNRMQPDVIIAYPDNRKVIVDSKVSLSAYTRYASCNSVEEQKKHIKDHLQSVRRHIDELSNKSYQDYADTLDFVMMFVPNEPAYLLALQHDPDLWHYAYNKKILLIGPTNIIAALKMIVDLWKREYQNQNAQQIAERGAALYDKFVNFIDSFTSVGEQLDRAQTHYNTAFGQLSKGRGNLVGQTEKLKELGVKAKKNIPSSLIDMAQKENGINNS